MTSEVTTVTNQGNYDVSKLNAVQHGILSRHLVLPWEDSTEYAALIKALEHEYAPQGLTEHYLVQELASNIWRRTRLRGAEKAIHLKRLHYTLRHSQSDDAPINTVLMGTGNNNTKTKEAITETAAETKETLEHTQMLLDASNQALTILENETAVTYREALGALANEDSEAWPEWIGEPIHEYSSQKYESDAKSLKKWVQQNVKHYTRTIAELEHRPAIKDQVVGDSFPDHKMDQLSRYEVHLDRKFERTLSTLLKLQEVRKPPLSVAVT